MKRTLFVLLALSLALPVGAATIEYQIGAGSPPIVTLQSAATTGNGDVINLRGAFSSQTLYVIWSAGTGAGVVTVETASTCDYAGTWGSLATVTWSAASKTDEVKVFGNTVCMRARISTTVTGGTVTVKAVAAK
jgi:hypothetical protein